MTSGIKSIVLGLMVFVLLAGCTALAYARWTRPITEADAALAAGQFDRALASYGVAETRFDQIPPIKQLFSSEYNRLIANQLWLLYRMGRYDEIIDKAERAPEGAMPHFWAGLALYHKGDAERKQEARQQLLTSAQQELHHAVEAAPEDWDTKYDFELVTRLQKTMAAHSKDSATQPLNLLRPEPSKNKPAKIGG
jgi:tetratricopeptide (TPR) repeat protein